MKTNRVQETTWLTEDKSKDEIKQIKELVIISTKIQLARIEKGLTQKEFANLMGVTQGMVSRWESGEYNFTIDTLLSICKALDLEFFPSLSKKKLTI